MFLFNELIKRQKTLIKLKIQEFDWRSIINLARYISSNTSCQSPKFEAFHVATNHS